MAGLLGDIYSASNTLKRKVNGLLSDPMGTVNQFVGQLGDDTNTNINNMLVGHGLFGNKSVLTTPQQAQAARAALADYGAQSGMAAATVWHGSPHKFDKFDAGKIGTGEGAQAYGHGLYLAENPSVASSYQDLGKTVNLGGKQLIQSGSKGDLVGTTGNSLLDDYLHSNMGNTSSARRDILEASKYIKTGNPTAAKEYQQALADLRKVRGSVSVENAGSLYKVDLPDEHIAKMLDWDAPLNRQSDSVKEALNPLIPKIRAAAKGDDGLGGYLGKGIYELLGDGKASPQTAQMLRDAGIPGIRYLDGGSRGAGAGSSNFVVFPGNEGLLNIMERNGQPVNAMRGLLGK